MNNSNPNGVIYKKIVSFLVFCVASLTAISADYEADELLGIWLNDERDAHVKIYKCGEEFCGKIVWLKESEEDGSPKKDRKNPKDELKERPLKGLDILTGFNYDGGRKWEDGTIYNPRDGKTYSCFLQILEDGRLKVRGFIGISLIGKTNYWTRIE